MEIAMLDHLFNIKNDRRLSIYLYRLGFAMWLLYIVMGAPALKAFHHYRTDCGVLSFVLMVVSFSFSMVYDYFNDQMSYRTKKKWLLISYLILAVLFCYLRFN